MLIKKQFNFVSSSSLAQQEWADGSGLEMYETPARMYDAQIGRFGQVDPLMEQSADASEYAFVLNNPVSMVDPMGLTPIEDLINDAWNNSGVNGGYFEVENGRLKDMDGGGSFNFTSQNEAFGFGAAQMGANGWYGSQSGYATSFSDALHNYSGGNGTITSGMAQGYFEQHYAGSYYQVTAGYSPNGRGFNVSYNSTENGDGTSNDEGIHNEYASMEKLMYLFGMVEGEEGNGGLEIAHHFLHWTEFTFTAGEISNASKTFGEFGGEAYWVGKNLKIYSPAWGGNGFTGGRNAVQEFAEGMGKVAKPLGIITAGYSLVQTGVDIYNGDFKAAGVHGLDAVMGVIGTFGGPVGWAVSGAYFISRFWWGDDDD